MNSFIKKVFLVLRKKIQTTALIDLIFTGLEPEFSHISIIKTFAKEGRKIIHKVMKEIPHLKHSQEVN